LGEGTERRTARRVLIDLSPLRRSRDLRCLVLGELAVPDALRGRLSGLQIAVVTGGPRIGDLESGVVAAALGDTVSVVSGGLACIAGALVLARVLPGFRRQRTPEHSGPSRTLDTAPTGRDPSE
jgi:hypothetical protein